MGRHLGAFKSGTATAGSTQQYLEDTVKLRTSLALDDGYNEWFMLRPDAAAPGDVLRLVEKWDVVNGWLYPDFPEGVGWTNPPYVGSTGELYELHGPWFDPVDEQPFFLNAALKMIKVPAEIAFAATADVIRQNLATALPWLDNADDIFEVGYLGNAENQNVTDPFSARRLLRGSVTGASGAFYLNTQRAFAAGEVLYVRCLAPAYAVCRAGSSGPFVKTDGLTADANEAIPNEQWIVAGAMVEAWSSAGNVLEAAAAKNRVTNLQTAMAAFRRWEEIVYPTYNLTRTFTPLTDVGNYGRVV